MLFVYIIQSEVDNSFYVGFTKDLAMRLEFHNDPERNIGVTRHKIPWRYFHTIKTPCKSIAIKIEKHIKRMKSHSYIINLKKYPEMSEKLLKKYS
jgi:putative endonuclease